MLSKTFLLIATIPLRAVVGEAQPPAAVSNQQILDQLKSMQSALERIEKGQKTLMALARIQIDSSQVAVLEQRRQRLSVQEQELGGRFTEASRSGEAQSQTSFPEGAPRPTTDPELDAARTRIAQADSALKDLQRLRQTVEEEIVRLRGRIAAMEKLLDQAMR